MTRRDWSARPAFEQARALREGLVSARALLEACLERIARDDVAIGAFWHIDVEGARAAADRSDGRRKSGKALGAFDGLSIAVKDNIDVEGLPSTGGLAAFRRRKAEADAFVAARLRANGLVMIGKAALHEGALGGTCDAPGFGRCENPLQAGLTPGGSSGGSGAAIAAGFAALALGTDTMGSVRIPAAYCGVAGLKPTAGLVSRSGALALSTTLDTVGTLALRPRDAALALGLIAGFDRADRQSLRAPDGWEAFPSSAPAWSAHRIGVPAQLDALDIEPAIAAAFEQACRAAEARGARLVRIDVEGWSPMALRRAALLLAEAEGSVEHAALIDDPEAASPSYRAALDYGRKASAARLVAALGEIAWARAGALRALGEVDALLTPTTPQRAFPHDAKAPANQADLTTLANAAGLPAIAWPWPASGLPASIQLVGRPFEEARIAALSEGLMPEG
jgi:aspartyl-tRNA(Asn)/glutamyl-tRNA(Gln) amidotransferase subunit A